MGHVKTQVNKTGGWVRARSEFPTSLDRDKRLRELEADLMACSMGRRTGCKFCPCQSECDALWNRASTQSSVRYLLPGELEDFRKQFASIRQTAMRNEVVHIACCPECRMSGLRLYDENGDKCPVKGHHQWCRRCQEWVIPERRTVLRYGRLK